MFKGFCAAVLVLLIAMVAAAQAETLTWQMRSYYPYKVQVEFYSQWYNRAWPGGSRAYDLNDSAVHTFTLNCESGEKICYGAWVTGDSSIYWGVGLNDAYGCSDCCYTCDGGVTPIRSLDD